MKPLAALKRLASRDNPRIRLLLRLLARPRECRRQGVTILDGVHLLDSLLDSGACPLWGAVTAHAMQGVEVSAAVERSAAAGCEWFELPEALFRQVAPTAHPSGVLTVLALPAAAASHPPANTASNAAVEAATDAPGPTGTAELAAVRQGVGLAAIDAGLCVLLLEDIQDPGNLGTLLRSAQGAGVQHVALSAGCAEPWAPKVLRAGMGAHFHLTLHEDVDLPRFAAQRGAVWAAAADGAHSCWQAPLSSARGIAIGNEGAGISAALRAACQGVVAIPLQQGCESLNAAIAGSVLLFERARQRAR